MGWKSSYHILLTIISRRTRLRNSDNEECMYAFGKAYLIYSTTPLWSGGWTARVMKKSTCDRIRGARVDAWCGQITASCVCSPKCAIFTLRSTGWSQRQSCDLLKKTPAQFCSRRFLEENESLIILFEGKKVPRFYPLFLLSVNKNKTLFQPISISHRMLQNFLDAASCRVFSCKARKHARVCVHLCLCLCKCLLCDFLFAHFPYSCRGCVNFYVLRQNLLTHQTETCILSHFFVFSLHNEIFKYAEN